MSLSYPEARVRTMPLRPMIRAASGLVGVALLAAAPHALAQQWVLEPRVEVGGIYDDNYRMTNTPGQEIEVTGAGVEALLRARRATAKSSFEITPEIHSTFFPDESSEESTDYFLAMSGDMAHSTQQAFAQLAGTIQQQAAVMTYSETFFVMAIAMILCVPLALFLRKTTPPAAGPGPGAAASGH